MASVMRIEAQAEDPWISRARPTFLYVMYALLLWAIPMGLIGSVWGLYVTGTTINSVALIGLIMLAGIVVNNAIVLIDAINQARERGLEKLAAIKLAGRTRLRPILITSVSSGKIAVAMHRAARFHAARC